MISVEDGVDGVRAPRVMVLAMDPKLSMDPDPSVEPKRQYARIIGLARHFVEEESARVDVVTAEPGGWEKLDERVRLHRLDAAEARHPLPWLEHMLVIRLPRVAVRPVARLGRPGARLERARTSASRTVHKRLFLPFYRHARPLVLARVARRRLPRDLAAAPPVRIIVMDRTSVPLARRLARLHPDAVVTTRQDRSLRARP
ncbi:hypothetical protein [Actinomadura algeriensis]|uniref:Uncharacterized protein n=1 Tax=Actinomadura algeriensis TaxID=1679523 RepID=A0ABR9JR85_9ACTN|nr:hypothetical protein [Actinomadura algeriensis]MBE1533089.1 hypothetical protein [Actinomadura algeriensis]